MLAVLPVCSHKENRHQVEYWIVNVGECIRHPDPWSCNLCPKVDGPFHSKTTALENIEFYTEAAVPTDLFD